MLAVLIESWHVGWKLREWNKSRHLLFGSSTVNIFLQLEWPVFYVWCMLKLYNEDQWESSVKWQSHQSWPWCQRWASLRKEQLGKSNTSCSPLGMMLDAVESRSTSIGTNMTWKCCSQRRSQMTQACPPRKKEITNAYRICGMISLEEGVLWRNGYKLE